jgi:8-oxo-dGTP pyrophosphatase MutT (NUDIX family)
VRARDAASLILLRGAGSGLELLAGRRPLSARFMPGVYVFPGGRVEREDSAAWGVETGQDALPPRLLRCARAALRETWEESGVLLGRAGADVDVDVDADAGPPSGRQGRRPSAAAPIAAAYRARGAQAPFDRLVYIGRAITPARVFRRFNTRFFLGEGTDAIGEPAASDELEDVAWHPIGRRALEPFRDVTRFMLARAIAVRDGTATPEPLLFYTVGGTRRVRVCREAEPAS